jgi:DNA repair exonuclease SbcCD ATPase subunit
MFIVDEGFGKLDPKNMESVQRMFDYLKSIFDHIIVISHIDSMKDMVDNIIEITTDDEGYAHVSVGG